MAIVETVNLVSYWLNIIVGIPMLMLGITGSILTVLIFTTKQSFRHNPCVFYLLATATCNFIQLAHTLLTRILYDGFALPLYNTNAIFCRSRAYISSVATVCAICFSCWAAFDQYVNSSRHATVRQRWSSVQTAHRIILATILVCLLIHLPHLFVNDVLNNICKSNSVTFSLFNAYAFVPIVYGIAPILLITFFTVSTARNLRMHAAQRGRCDLAEQLRRMLIPQLIALAISGLPFSLQVAYATATSTINKGPLRNAIENLIYQIVRLLFYCNYACTFYIYIYVSSKMRQSLWRLVTTCTRRARVEPIMTNRRATNEIVKHTHIRTLSNAAPKIIQNHRLSST